MTISDTPPAGWGQLPPAGTVIGVSFWVAALGDVLNALLAAGAQAGVRFAVTGPAGAGLVYACLDPTAAWTRPRTMTPPPPGS